MDSNKSSHAIFAKCKAEYSSMVISLFQSVYLCHFGLKNVNKDKQLNYPFLISGNFNFIGDKFIIQENDMNIKMFVEIKELLVTDYFSRINFHVYKTIPKTFEYEIIFDVYCNSFNGECTLFSSFIYDKHIFISDEIKKKVLYERNNMIKSLEQSVSNNELSKLIIISELINCNIDLLWAFFLNMKIVHKYTKLIANKIEYEGNVIKKNKLMKLWKRGKKYNEAIVSKCCLILKDGEIEILINSTFNVNDIFNENRIFFKIYEYDNKCTIHLFFFFNNKYNDYQKHFYEIRKHKELRLIKKMVEHYNDNLGERIDDNSDNSSNNEIIVFESFDK